MSLSGRIEDLPLLDIVQIVAFTQRTGYIKVETDAGVGAVVFRSGRVVACFSPGSSERVPRSALTPAEWERRLTAGIAADLGTLSRLRDGQFGFVFSNDVPKEIEGYSLERETLAVGVDAQELLLGLTRELDESRRAAAAALAAPEAAPVLETPSGPTTAGAEIRPSVLVVDDEPDVRAFVMKRLIDGGYEDVVGAGHARVRSSTGPADGAGGGHVPGRGGSFHSRSRPEEACPAALNWPCACAESEAGRGWSW